MRTAVLISGQIRNAKDGYSSLTEKIIKPYNADVFIETWCPQNEILDHRNKIIPNNMTADEIILSYKPKVISFEDFDGAENIHRIAHQEIQNRNGFDGSYAWETKTPNVFYMYYKIWKNYISMNQYEKLNGIRYDILVRTRFDLEYDEFPLFEDIAPNQIYIPSGSNHRGGICDLFAIGGRDSMEKYFKLFEYIKIYIETNATFHPESLLRYHLNNFDLDVRRFDLKYKIRGSYVV